MLVGRDGRQRILGEPKGTLMVAPLAGERMGEEEPTTPHLQRFRALRTSTFQTHEREAFLESAA